MKKGTRILLWVAAAAVVLGGVRLSDASIHGCHIHVHIWIVGCALALEM